MPDIRILLVIAVAVIGFPLFVVLFFRHFYRLINIISAKIMPIIETNDNLCALLTFIP